jgi:hypothetical protein
VVALLSGAGIVAAQPARAVEPCTTQRLFAVAADTGHLVEVAACVSRPGFGPRVEVDDGDWRAYRHIFGAADATTVVLYTLDADGALWSRRQEAPGAAFGPPVRVAASLDWSQFDSVFVAQPGYLHTAERDGPVRTFQHLDWSAGGAVVSEGQPLLRTTFGPPMTAARWGGRGEAFSNGRHVLIYRSQFYLDRFDHEDAFYDGGLPPPGVTGVVGVEPRYYGIDASGALVQLDHPADEPDSGTGGNSHPWSVLHMYYENSRWYFVTPVPGPFARLVVPATRNPAVTTPAILSRPATGFSDDPEGPLEWQ